MYVSTSTRKVVLNLSNPARVTTVVPTAKVFQYKGRDLVAVPHRQDEMRVLKNLGIAAPAPILSYYDWPGRYKPFAAQRDTAQFLTMNPRSFCLNDMGTGKTISVLWAYDYLRSVGQVRKMLVVSPLSTLETTWANEIFQHFPHLTAAVLHGSKDRRLRLLASDDYDIYIINHHGLKTINDELRDRKDIDVVVVDEGAAFRNASTILWKSLSKLAKDRPWVWWLTGTPTPNDARDAWAQCRIIAPERVPQYMSGWQALTMVQKGTYQWVERKEATQIVADAMQPSIRYSRDQCVDLPPCVYVDRQVSLSPTQDAAYKTMMSKLVADHADGQITAVNEAVKLQKLVQICCGVAYGADGNHIKIEAPERIALVKEIIEQSGSKVIIYVPFTGVLEYVAEELRKDYEVGVIAGSVSKSQRDEVFKAFQHGANMRVLVAQPAAMSHGLTLTAASTIIWYAPITSNETKEQADARITRPGQKHSQLIVHISGSSAERRIYARVRNKQTGQGLLLEILKGVS
jgi:SNF2 family DNA or RNA helicase